MNHFESRQTIFAAFRCNAYDEDNETFEMRSFLSADLSVECDGSLEHEGADRTTIGLPAPQLAMRMVVLPTVEEALRPPRTVRVPPLATPRRTTLPPRTGGLLLHTMEELQGVQRRR